MDERRHSVANPEVCGTHCHVSRYMPLLERNISEIVDADESYSTKEDNNYVSPLSPLSLGSDVSNYPVPQFTFTVDENAATGDEFHTHDDDLTLRNHEGIQDDNSSTSDPTPMSGLGERCCWLAAPDPSAGIVPSHTESVCDSEQYSPTDTGAPQHMDILKKITERLHLATRRPSYVVWKNKYIDDAPNSRLAPTLGMYSELKPVIIMAGMAVVLRGWLPHRGEAQMAYNYCFPTRTMF